MIVSLVVLIPLLVSFVIGSVLKNSFLNLVPIIGSNIQPDPLPPVIPIDTIRSTSKFWGSTKTSSTLPDITGCTNAVVPTPVDIVILGKFITS